MRKWLWITVALVAVIGLAVGGGTALANRSASNVQVADASYQLGAFLDNATITRVATVLGLTPADLTAQLQGGKTLAQVARDKGVDTAKVVDAILAPHKDQVQLQLKYGYVTQAQADLFLANARQRAESLLNQTFNSSVGTGSAGLPNEDMIQACNNIMGGTEMGNMMQGMGRSNFGGGGMMGSGMMQGWNSGSQSGSGPTGRGMMGGGGAGMMGGWNGSGTQSGFGSGRGMMGGW